MGGDVFLRRNGRFAPLNPRKAANLRIEVVEFEETVIMSTHSKPTLSATALTMGSLVVSAPASAAGHWDRIEDRIDRAEDVRDRRH